MVSIKAPQYLLLQNIMRRSFHTVENFISLHSQHNYQGMVWTT